MNEKEEQNERIVPECYARNLPKQQVRHVTSRAKERREEQRKKQIRTAIFKCVGMVLFVAILFGILFLLMCVDIRS